MKDSVTRWSLVLLCALLAMNFIAGPVASVAQGNGIALATASSKSGEPACWIAVGNKLYYVEKDETTVLKVKASGSL